MNVMEKQNYFKIVLPFILLMLILIIPATRWIFSATVLSPIDNLMYGLINKNTKDKYENVSRRSQAECSQIGGKWEALGMSSKESCQIYANDAGKPCFAGFQCDLGICQTAIVNKPLTLGNCRHVLNGYGCSQVVHFGVAGWGLCID